MCGFRKIFKKSPFSKNGKEDFQKRRFSKNLLLCGFRKEYSNQYALVNLLQKWKKGLDEPGGIVGTLLMNLSKAYDCVNHELIIAKLAAYGLNESNLRLIQNYLSKRKQRVKIGSSLTEWLEVIIGVSEGSIFGSILINILINDLHLFIKETDVCNFADNTTLYKCVFFCFFFQVWKGFRCCFRNFGGGCYYINKLAQ